MSDESKPTIPFYELLHGADRVRITPYGCFKWSYRTRGWEDHLNWRESSGEDGFAEVLVDELRRLCNVGEGNTIPFEQSIESRFSALEAKCDALQRLADSLGLAESLVNDRLEKLEQEASWAKQPGDTLARGATCADCMGTGQHICDENDHCHACGGTGRR